MFGPPGAEIAMAHQIIIDISSNSSGFAEEDDVSCVDFSGVGSYPNGSSGSWAISISGLPISSDSESVAKSTAYCQCEEGTLAECPTCRSFFDIDTVCPLSL